MKTFESIKQPFSRLPGN